MKFIKSKERASSDVGLMFISYNLKRLINILSTKELKEYLKALVLLFFRTKSYLNLKIRLFKTLFIFQKIYINQIFFDKKLLKTSCF